MLVNKRKFLGDRDVSSTHRSLGTAHATKSALEELTCFVQVILIPSPCFYSVKEDLVLLRCLDTFPHCIFSPNCV